jgi:hypothetical protein
VGVGVTVEAVKGGRCTPSILVAQANGGQLRKLGELSRSGTATLGTAAVKGSLAGRASGQGLDARCARFAGNLRTWPAMPRVPGLLGRPDARYRAAPPQ